MSRATKKLSLVIIIAVAFLAMGCDATNAVTELSPVSTQKSGSIGEVVSEIGSNIWVVYQDKYGHYWFGSEGKGVFRFDGKEFRQFQPQAKG